MAPCRAALARARTELLERGFAPVVDPSKWLRLIDDVHPGEVELAVEMRASADGAATWYSVTVRPSAAKKRPSAWRKSVRRVCCDEHAAPEDNIAELSWQRREAEREAEVSIGYFAAVTDKQYQAERALFIEVAKRAADACLTPTTTPATTALPSITAP